MYYDLTQYANLCNFLCEINHTYYHTYKICIYNIYIYINYYPFKIILN